ncbi:hypothetical protein GN316_01670 [Xylophilus sp. Kf1]|nr:hypothetical protein [Xylophilus sp. Kf1]
MDAMVSFFHSQGITFIACAVACREGWISTVDIVMDAVEVSRHQRLEVYPTQVAAALASFADASHLAALVRRLD